MLARVLNSDGSASEIPVQWHPAVTRYCDQFTTYTAPSGLWTTVSKIKAKYGAVNAYRRANGIPERDLDAVVDGIECAEAEIEIYADSDQEDPYCHNGLLVKKIRRGGSDDFWNNHA